MTSLLCNKLISEKNLIFIDLLLLVENYTLGNLYVEITKET